MLVVSIALRQEYVRVLADPSVIERYDLSPSDFASFIGAVDLDSIEVESNMTTDIEVRDPDDVAILDTAINGNADYLVTGDNDLLSLADDKRLGKLQIVGPRAFLDILINES